MYVYALSIILYLFCQAYKEDHSADEDEVHAKFLGSTWL